MPNRRYHVHLACVATDPLLALAQDDVALFFENRAMITKDCLVPRAESASYSWRCVNAADIVVVLIGNVYGRLNYTGVSQLHVSYSNAKAKHKPIIVLVHTKIQTEHEGDKKLVDFVASIESQATDFIYYFDEATNIQSLLEEGINQINMASLDDYGVGANESTTYQDVHQDLKNEPKIQADRPTNIGDIFDDITPAYKDSTAIHSDLKPALILENDFNVDCTAHAFQGGTLLEVGFTTTFLWRRIVGRLSKMNSPFSELSLTKMLNEMIDKDEANQEVLKKYPEVHALSRLQVSKSDVIWVRDELELAGWIESTGQSATWRVSDKALSAAS